MTGITLAQAQAQLDKWIEADTKVAKNQSYSINGRSLTRANAGEISSKIDYWSKKVSQLSSSSARGVGYGVSL